jgi:hypothetical protein
MPYVQYYTHNSGVRLREKERTECRDGIFKPFRSPGIDSKEYIPGLLDRFGKKKRKI